MIADLIRDAALHSDRSRVVCQATAIFQRPIVNVDVCYRVHDPVVSDTIEHRVREYKEKIHGRG